MAKVVSEHDIDEITCPGCKANIQIEREKPTHKIIEHGHDHNDGLSKQLEEIKEALKPKEVVKEEPKEPKAKVPPHIKKYKCKGCGNLHDNDEYEGPAIGKCDTCDEKFTKKRKGKCPYCTDGRIEEYEDSAPRYDAEEDEDDE